MTRTAVQHAEIPYKLIEKWQSVVDTLAAVLDVPAALIMRVDEPFIEVFRSSRTDGNPYHVGDRECLAGLYCERVIEERKRLLVPDARLDVEWRENPDIDVGMVAYLGYPLLWSDDEVFGTLCVLDRKGNRFGELYETLVKQFADLISAHLGILDRNRSLQEAGEQLQQALAEVRTLRGLVPICASCKRIRDDDGYWKAVEVYIERHCDAHFTHGICPACAKQIDREAPEE
jgi:GAF domain-containing protein